ncbi:TonB-dependent receptor [Sphingomonas sp. AR_OL41]|uniref:TonB-dependent receptor domain-containing protein n=1 Tax=Sphingomonas sp. AR_OL41 TaxID=3042729 RepID=UPI002480EB40|nr:TonB-dependent receptor [Sphingomonas sp. AR_OL41]MDH7974406.1 TonB-dependent receptor [Sphingomonas sp. AR_OL41]
MKKSLLLLTAAPLALAVPATAQVAAAPPAKQASGTASAPAEEAFTTGVAKGRDRLDSATSTSALKGGDIEEFGARSLGEILRNIPGIRAESEGGEGNASYSIRGLPLAATGSKYLQLQEDGLPVLEFGDMQQFAPDMFMRADLNLSAVEAIRGGSASTFASNSPGGVINLLSKTGDVEGGAVQTTLGLNYGEHRIDADYGHKLSDTLRFHIGGFYRQGEGPRNLGYDGYKGGQLKFNVTRTFGNGFVRVYGKYLNDRTPSYQPIPIMVSGSDANPAFTNVPGVDIRTDSLLSRNNNNVLTLDGANNIKRDDARDGMHAVVKAIGFEAQFDFGDWSFNDKFRFAAISGGTIQTLPLAVAPAAALAYAYGGPGASLSYATGPRAGQLIASPGALNGNGLLLSSIFLDTTANSLQNVTNDLRASRVWKIGHGELTMTAGFYKSSQTYNSDWSFLNILSDVRGGGDAALVNVTNAAGVPTTQDGYIAFGINGALYHRRYDVTYAVNAPYGSLNYHIGKLAIGGSVRYDMGKASGSVFGADLGGGRIGVAPIDLNGDGHISIPESQTATLPLGSPGNVDYSYHYLSYSVGANFRIAEPLAMFARYSRGGRAAADKVLFTPAIGVQSGQLLDPASGFDTVKQSEVGLKFRKSGITVNVTGFSATTGERNVQVNSKPDGSIQVENIVRGYSAKGVEVEAGVRHGPFRLTAGATYTSAKIASDAAHLTLIGNVPRHQASFLFETTPQIETKYATVGANIVGTTSSYAQDVNQLKLPGYTLVNAFVQVRPMQRMQVMLNVNNLFDTVALAEITQGTIPASGIVLGRAMNGRTISTSLRLSF